MIAPRRLRDLNTTDNVLLLALAVRIGPPLMAIMMLIEFVFVGKRFIWFIVPDLAATVLLVLGARWGLEQFARGAGSILMPSGKGTPTARQYSEQESLIVRGQYAQAADAYRSIVEAEPGNIDARMRLAAVLANECNDPVAAEYAYRAVRRLSPTPHQDFAASNALIELHQRTGSPEKVTAELLRLSRQYGDAPIGMKAREHLERLRAEAEYPESRQVPPE